ncbi:MAG TPA: site-specific integrase [Chloroflexota bacterium]|jgi:integrase
MTRRGNGEGSIYHREQRYKKKDGTVVTRTVWCASISQDLGKRKVIYGATREEVAKKLVSELNDYARGVPSPGVRLSTAAYLEDWLEHTVRPSQKPLTYEKYRGVVDNHILPSVGKVPLSRLGPGHVQRIQAQMTQKGLSVATINGMRTTLGAALSQAEKWNLVVRNVVRLVDAPRQVAHEPRVLTAEEAAAFLAAARGDDMELLFQTMLATGLRPGEARGLRWIDVQLDVEPPALHVRQQVLELKDDTPGGKQRRRPRKRVFDAPKSIHGRRSVPLIPLAITALRAQRERARELPLRGVQDLVFPSESGQPLVGRTVRDHFARIARQARIAGATPHTLRHSTGTYLLAAGVPDRVVQAILGHGSAAVTRHYQHVLPSMLAEAGAQLARFWDAAT